MIIACAIGAFTLLGLSAIAWAMWLDYRTATRVLDLVEASVRAGLAAPPEVLARLGGPHEAAPRPLTRQSVRRVSLLLLVIGALALLGSAAAHDVEREQAFLLIAAIAAIAGAIGLLALSFGRRLGL